jgi:hypothetical protein
MGRAEVIAVVFHQPEVVAATEAGGGRLERVTLGRTTIKGWAYQGNRPLPAGRSELAMEANGGGGVSAVW